MLRLLRQLFSFYNPLFYVLLLGAIVVLRWPIFEPGYAAPYESFAATVAGRIAAGHPLYAETLVNGQPVMLWVYTLFVGIWGEAGMVAIKLFATGYIFIIGLLLNALYNTYKFHESPSTLPSVLFVGVVCLPWHTQELTPELVLIMPFLIALRRVISYSFEKESRWEQLFFIGALSMVMLLISIHAIFLVVALACAYILLCKPKLHEAVTFLGGMLAIVAAFAVLLRAQGTLLGYWAAALHQPNIAIPVLPGMQAAIAWGMMALLGAVGWLYFRSRFYQQVIRLRRAGDAMTLWLLAGLGLLAVNGFRLEYTLLVWLMPPVVFFAAYVLENGIGLWLRILLHVLLMVPVLYQVLVARPSLQEHLPDTLAELVATEAQRTQQSGVLPTAEAHALAQDTASKTGVWITGNDYRLYWQAQVPVAIPFVDYGKAQDFFGEVSYRAQGGASPEQVERIQAFFTQYSPAVVYDRSGLFAELKDTFPALLVEYTLKEAGGIALYTRQKLPQSTHPRVTTK